MFLFLFYVHRDAALPALSIISILIVISLFFLTFRDSTKVDSKKVLKSSILPIGIISVLFIAAIIFEETSRHTSFYRSIELEEIEVVDPILRIEDHLYGSKKAIFEGRLRNNSDQTLRRISFRIRIFQFTYKPQEEIPEGTTLPLGYIFGGAYLPSVEGAFGDVGDQIDSDEFYARYLLVGQNETKSFSFDRSPTNLRPSGSWAWDFEILSASSSY